MNSFDYSYLLETPAARQWKRIEARRRAGVIAPLFSIHSKKSTGIGEIPDLSLLADWCEATGQSLIQLLPLQDVAFDFCPYDAVSSFALDPMYLRLESLKGVARGAHRDRVRDLREKFPAGGPRVDYRIKADKLALLWEIFSTVRESLEGDEDFSRFLKKEAFWIGDYALYKVIRYLNHERPWTEWDDALRQRRPEALNRVADEHRASLQFHQWLQWQLWEQMRAARSACARRGVLLAGDMPFLVSRNSADVWANQRFFKLDLASGAPPDYFLAEGQRWGMPPYDWPAIAADGYRYLKEKLRYSQEFYDLYRIDHAIGMFRLWTIKMDEPLHNAGRHGTFDPPHEPDWEGHGTRIFRTILDSTRMLPCAEDLGMIPKCSNPTLHRLGIPGMDIQRWLRDPKDERRILPPEEYRTNSIATLSTHDMYPVIRWWRDLPPHERWEFAVYLGISETAGLAEAAAAALSKVSRSASVFSVQSLQDWFSLGLPDHESRLLEPVNVPGSIGPQNWSWVSPYSLETMAGLPLNASVLRLNQSSGRA